MNAQDSSGRHISLLNDDDSVPKASTRRLSYSRYEDNYSMGRSKYYASEASSPSTPGLLQSDSYDSQNIYDFASPITPVTYDLGAQSSYQKDIAYPEPLEYEQKSECHSMFDAYLSKRYSISTVVHPSFICRN